MAEINVTIISTSADKQWPANVPDDVPAKDVIRALVKQQRLPMEHEGDPVSYRFHHKQSGRLLNGQQSLRDGGVRSGHILRLQAELQAGAVRLARRSSPAGT